MIYWFDAYKIGFYFQEKEEFDRIFKFISHTFINYFYLISRGFGVLGFWGFADFDQQLKE